MQTDWPVEFIQVVASWCDSTNQYNCVKHNINCTSSSFFMHENALRDHHENCTPMVGGAILRVAACTACTDCVEGSIS